MLKRVQHDKEALRAVFAWIPAFAGMTVTRDSPMSSLDKTSLTSQLLRFTQVGGKGLGLIARLLAENYMGLNIDRKKHAAKLKEALSELRGPLMKIAQLLATIPEAIPPEYVQEFMQLQAEAPPMGWPFVKRRMIAELGLDWTKKYAAFTQEAAAAASLGQVHKAISHQGQLLAVKLQYPKMEDAVIADMKQLRLVFDLLGRFSKAIGTEEIVEEIQDRLYEELDYEQESRHMLLYGKMLSSTPTVHVPKPDLELTTKHVLTMSWLEGKPLLAFKEASQEVRNTIAMNLFKAWYVPVYHYGIIHGDPHLGNYSLTESYDLNLLDFGCIRIFPPRFIQGVIDLYHALQKDDRALAIHAYELWGFKNLSVEMIEILNVWARFLYGPILEDRSRKIQEREEKGVYGRAIAEKVHAELKKIGGISPPREFVFMDRAALGLGSVFIHLQADINWHNLFNELIQDFDIDKIETQQKALIS